MHPLLRPFWNHDERRLRAFWRLFVQAVMLAAGMVLVALGFSLFTKLLGSPPAETAIGMFGSLMLIGVVCLAAWLLDRRSPSQLGLLIDRDWMIDCLFGMVLGLLLMALIVVAGVAAGWMAVTVEHHSPIRIVMILVLGLVEFLLVAVGEELFSRGYHVRNIAEGLRCGRFGARAAVVVSVLISSAIFSALHIPGSHASALALASLFLAGVLLSLSYVFTGRLGLSIGLHLTWNFAQGTLFGLAVSGSEPRPSLLSIDDRGPALWTGGGFGPEGGLLGIAATVLGIAITLAWLRLRHGRLSICEPLAYYEPIVAGAYAPSYPAEGMPSDDEPDGLCPPAKDQPAQQQPDDGGGFGHG